MSPTNLTITERRHSLIRNVFLITKIRAHPEWPAIHTALKALRAAPRKDLSDNVRAKHRRTIEESPAEVRDLAKRYNSLRTSILGLRAQIMGMKEISA